MVLFDKEIIAYYDVSNKLCFNLNYIKCYEVFINRYLQSTIVSKLRFTIEKYR